MTRQIVQCLDAFTTDVVDGEKAIVALPNVVGDAETKWAGSAVYGGAFIADLVQYGIEHGVVRPEQVEDAIVAGTEASKVMR